MKKILAFLPSLFILQGCNSASAEDSISSSDYFEFEVIHSSDYNDYAAQASKKIKILESQEEYESELLLKTSSDAEVIDMDTSTVLLVDMGSLSNGSFDFEISYSEQDEHYFKLDVKYTYADDSCDFTTVETNPYKFIKVYTKKFIIVNETYSSTSCE